MDSVYLIMPSQLKSCTVHRMVG